MQDLFPLPNLASDLAKIRDDIINGKGFVLFRNIPVTEWGLQKSATAYMGLGTYFGYFTAQNGRGHVLGHVKDLSSKADPNDKTVIPSHLFKRWICADECSQSGSIEQISDNCSIRTEPTLLDYSV
jgi:hypothetical protein